MLIDQNMFCSVLLRALVRRNPMYLESIITNQVQANFCRDGWTGSGGALVAFQGIRSPHPPKSKANRVWHFEPLWYMLICVDACVNIKVLSGWHKAVENCLSKGGEDLVLCNWWTTAPVLVRSSVSSSALLLEVEEETAEEDIKEFDSMWWEIRKELDGYLQASQEHVRATQAAAQMLQNYAAKCAAGFSEMKRAYSLSVRAETHAHKILKACMGRCFYRCCWDGLKGSRWGNSRSFGCARPPLFESKGDALKNERNWDTGVLWRIYWCCVYSGAESSSGSYEEGSLWSDSPAADGSFRGSLSQLLQYVFPSGRKPLELVCWIALPQASLEISWWSGALSSRCWGRLCYSTTRPNSERSEKTMFLRDLLSSFEFFDVPLEFFWVLLSSFNV